MRKFTLLLAAAALSANVAMAAVDYNLSPAAGVATDLETITLTFPTEKVMFYENNRTPVAVLENTTTGVVYNCEEAVRNTFAAVDGIEYNLTFIEESAEEAEPIKAPGNYVLTIRGMYTGDIEDPVDVDPITANYTINYPVAYTLTPAAGVATNLQGIELTFADDVVLFAENNRMAVATLENLTTGTIYTCQEADRNTFATATSAYTLTFLGEDDEDAPATIAEPGEYILSVRGLYVEDGDEMEFLPVITATYTVEYPFEYTLTPAAGIATDLQNMTLAFEVKGINFYENNRMPVVVLENLGTGAVYTAEPILNTRATAGTEFTLTFVDEDDYALEVISNPGNYLLTVRGLYYDNLTETTDDDVDLPVITAFYTINYPTDYTLTPAAGVVTDLQGIVLNFTEEKVGFFENNRAPVAVLENTTTGKVYNCEEALRDTKAMTDGAAYILTFLGEDDEEAPATISEPGEYVLTVRALCVGEGEDVEALPVITAKYTVEYPVAYSLEPAEGVVTDLQGITLTFSEAVVSFYENNRLPVAVLENTNTGVEYVCYEADRNTFTEAASEYTFNFVDEDEEVLPEINVPGTYKLTIRAMYVEEDEEDVTLPVITATYTINYPVAYELNPVNNAVVEEINTISLTFEDDVVLFYENNRMPVAVLTNVNSGVEYVCYEADRNTFVEGASGYTFTFVDDDEEAVTVVTPGEYQLTIRGMYIGDLEDEENDVVELPNIYATYTIAYPIDYTLEPANGATVGEITVVTLDFYNNKNIDFVGNRVAAAVITNGQLGDDEVAFKCEEPNMNPRAESEGRVYTFQFKNEDDELVAINEPGMYYLTISGFVTLALDENGEEEIDQYLPNIEAAYYVTGEEEEGGTSKVVDLTTPEGVYNVYSINGVQLVKNGSVDSLKALAKGIYVINGHKVVIR